MRLPRVRFTMRMLLFAVAVVAVNCWAFRHYYETDLYGGGMISYRILPHDVGVLPLFNVAIIGSLLGGARLFRRLRRGTGAHPGSSWSGIAYFGLNFLILGWLVSLFMPGIFEGVREILNDATQYAAVSWGKVFPEPGGSVPWVIVESAILGVLISGPPLLLSWIGHLLAKRCAATLPRHRFRAMYGLVSLGFAAGALAICVTPQAFEEDRDVDLAFEIVARDTGRPVRSAFVQISDPFDTDSPTPRALTESDGLVRLTGRFPSSGEQNAFQSLGTFSPWGRWLEISAPDFQTLRIPLPRILGPDVDLDRPCPGKVMLDRGRTPANSWRDLAGTYHTTSNGFGGAGFIIEPDGRFGWTAWGCTANFYEYGYLKRSGDEIEVVPIPNPGREPFVQMTWKYRAIRWGDCLYLSSTEDPDIQKFCRGALTPDGRKRPGNAYGGYIRSTDDEKEPTGLPRLPPEVWAKFLADDIRLDNKEGSLRLALHSLLGRRD